MRKLLLLPLVLFTIASCAKEINIPEREKEPEVPFCGTCAMDPACFDTPPTDELCQAVFNRWFYNSETNECEQIGYSGCEQYGFETKQECEDCGCN